MAVSSDAPYLDTAYKLVEYAGHPRIKKSENKTNLPGRKQVFRQADRDVIGLQDELLEGTPLLQKMMEKGKIIGAPVTLEDCRRTLRADQTRLQGKLPYSVEISPEISRQLRQLREPNERN